jgi:hypothetical protein
MATPLTACVEAAPTCVLGRVGDGVCDTACNILVSRYEIIPIFPFIAATSIQCRDMSCLVFALGLSFYGAFRLPFPHIPLLLPHIAFSRSLYIEQACKYDGGDCSTATGSAIVQNRPAGFDDACPKPVKYTKHSSCTDGSSHCTLLAVGVEKYYDSFNGYYGYIEHNYNFHHKDSSNTLY